MERNASDGDGVDVAVGGPDGTKPVSAVVRVLGQTSDGPDDLVTVTGEHVLDAMERFGVYRYVTLVGADVREDDESVSVGGAVMNALL